MILIIPHVESEPGSTKALAIAYLQSFLMHQLTAYQKMSPSIYFEALFIKGKMYTALDVQDYKLWLEATVQHHTDT